MSPDNTECDCGRPKFGGSECCSHCAFLDGTQDGDARIIDALRRCDGMSQKEIEETTGYRGGSLSRRLQRLLASGRLSRLRREGDTKEFMGRSRYGGMIHMATGATDSFIYFLSTKRRAA